MILQLIDYIERDRFTVFFDGKQNLAFKIFKSYRHPDIADKSCYEENAYNEWMKQVYISEKTAYELLAKSRVSQYFLKCYSGYNVEKVIDKNYDDISKLYLPECTLVYDLIRGDAFKQNYPYVRSFCLQNQIDLDDIFSELKNIGVNFFRDATVVFLHGKEKMKIVDVAIHDCIDFQPPLLKNSDIESKPDH
jgi:hypothetical protein